MPVVVTGAPLVQCSLTDDGHIDLTDSKLVHVWARTLTAPAAASTYSSSLPYPGLPPPWQRWPNGPTPTSLIGRPRRL